MTSALNALSTIDGRYSAQADNLRPFFSEFGLIKNRVKIEILWLMALSDDLEIKEVPKFSEKTKQKLNSIILNYDESSESLFKWYQQLIAESLGKKGVGILPIISSMPMDNHSLMQLYLDGPKNNFFTFFDVMNDKTKKINEKKLLKSHIYLKNKTISDIKLAQKYATQNINNKVLNRKRIIAFAIFCI
jgi:hypothetical protein